MELIPLKQSGSEKLMSKIYFNKFIMKSNSIAFLLWFFLGFLSAHRFYCGKIGSGILYLITGQLFGIGWLIDVFLISGMVERCNTKEELKTIRTATLANATK